MICAYYFCVDFHVCWIAIEGRWPRMNERIATHELCEFDDLVQWIVTEKWMNKPEESLMNTYHKWEHTQHRRKPQQVLATNRRNQPCNGDSVIFFFIQIRRMNHLHCSWLTTMISTNSWFRRRRLHSIRKSCLLSFCDSFNTKYKRYSSDAFQPHKSNANVCVLSLDGWQYWRQMRKTGKLRTKRVSEKSIWCGRFSSWYVRFLVTTYDE